MLPIRERFGPDRSKRRSQAVTIPYFSEAVYGQFSGPAEAIWGRRGGGGDRIALD
jgi:hypothetical protein